MNKDETLLNNKIILDFTQQYCSSYEEVLESEAFRAMLMRYLTTEHNESIQALKLFLGRSCSVNDLGLCSDQLTMLLRLLTTMSLEEISSSLSYYCGAHLLREALCTLVEDLYRSWLQHERYSLLVLEEMKSELSRVNFVQANTDLKHLLQNLYRTVLYNISGKESSVYRQVSAGVNCGLIGHHMNQLLPTGYEKLHDITYVDTVMLEMPFITYPKKNKRTGTFPETSVNPLDQVHVDSANFLCFPIKVGKLLALVYVHNCFITHGVSLANLFEFADAGELETTQADLIFVFGAETADDEPLDCYYRDLNHDLMLGVISNHACYDYFGYMKKMLLTLHNVKQIYDGHLPIHGAMVKIVLKSGKHANVILVGDSGAGKSECIEAFRVLADEHISDMTIIFDDMGVLELEENAWYQPELKAYGTEIGAFVRLDDLEPGYAYKQLFSSIFMNPDKINARLINIVSSYEDITQGEPVDALLYANNYHRLQTDEKALSFFNTKQEAVETFVEGKRMAKGTTQENGITTSYFANPFGPVQNQVACDELIDKQFTHIIESDIIIGEIYTQLGVEGLERQGPERAALDLFELINNLGRATDVRGNVPKKAHTG